MTVEPLAVDLRGVSVRDGRTLLLDSVEVRLAPGQSFAVIGPNSRERSALLRVVAGLSRPSSGQARIGGWSVYERPDKVRQLVGYVPDEPGLADRLSPLEHLHLVAAQRGLSRADARASAEAMLELVDLTKASRSEVGTLSRGQQRRLAMALALVHDPPIILLDEPFEGLDEPGRGEIVSVLLELRSMARTLLIACRSAADVQDICDIVAPCENGRLAQLARTEPALLIWIEVVSDVDAALRFLREQPRVSSLRHDGNFITFEGPSTPEERSDFAESLLHAGVHLSGFGTTATSAGGSAP